MQRITLYKLGRKLSTRPDAGPVACVVAVADEVVVDPAAERIYLGPMGTPTHAFRPGGLAIAARSGMFGLRVIQDATDRSPIVALTGEPAFPNADPPIGPGRGHVATTTTLPFEPTDPFEADAPAVHPEPVVGPVHKRTIRRRVDKKPKS